jgi:hypothetical protein
VETLQDTVAQTALGRERDQRGGRLLAIALLQRRLDGAKLLAVHAAAA